MEKYYRLIIPIVCFIICSCQDKKNVRLDTDTLIRELPKEKNGDIAFEYKTKDTLEKRIGLPDLSNGYDSVFIRLYYSYSSSNISQLVEIFYDKKNEEWQSRIHTLKFEYSINGDSLLNVKDSVRSSMPKSGWQVMMKKINSLDIFNLPDFRTFESYELPMDGAAVTVQVATKKKYRMYSYIMPILSKNSIIDAKKMVDILHVIEDELGFKQLGKM